MIKPRALRTGDRVAVVSPASPFSEDEFDRGLAELRRLGFEPAVDPRVFERRRFVSGPPEVRATVLMEALDDPGVAGVFGARGGYGSAQVLPWLDPARIAAARKPLVGYSDLTSLLQFVTQDCGVVSFHGPTVAGRLSEGPARYDPVSLIGLLTRADALGELRPDGLEVLRPGETDGLLLGGTLTQLCASLGTPFAFAPPPGFVLFAEDVNERPYRLDRQLTQLRLAGILSRAAAIVFGEMLGCDEPRGTLRAIEVIADLLEDFPGPVLWGFPSGHTSGATWTLPLGVRVRVLAVPPSPAVVVLESAVEG